ncbi:MAG TPA: ATP-binding protein [Solirubrobacteraceae bacterium]|nr:ATP-binding protein [Solirubrobacteraceae bacterium]
MAAPAPPGTPLLEAVEDIISGFAADADALRTVRHLARRRALALRMSSGAGTAAELLAVTGCAAEMIAALAPELTHRQAELGTMVELVAASIGITRSLLGRDVLRAAGLLQLRPALAIEVELALVLAFVRGRAAALWIQTPAGELVAVAGAGDADAVAQESRAVAAAVLAGETVTAPGEGEVATRSWREPVAALVVFGEAVLSPGSRLILEAAEPGLILALARRALAGAGPRPAPRDAPQGNGDAIEQDAQRRLSRLRFDLHDGPQQDVIMLAEDLRLFRDQLRTLAGDHALLGRVDDLEARLIALDGDLRRISVSVQSPFLHQKSLQDALGDLIDSFARRTGVIPTVSLSGDFTSLTDSQHITLLGLLREALSNIREHSRAEHVTVRLSAAGGAVSASVTDDGSGFDPETVLVSAARRGHLGLVGMHERVRLLGGSTTITSRPGGPTVIAATLPPAPVTAPRHG